MAMRSVRDVFGHIVNGAGRPKVLLLCFLLFGLPTGLGCALLTPVGMFPDEFAHAARADGLIHGEIYGTKPPPGFPPMMINAGVMVDNGIFAVMNSRAFPDAFPDRPVPADDRRAAEALPWFPGMSYYPSQMVEYFPIMYAPAALGLLAAKAAGLTPLQSYYAGRVAALLAFMALGMAAIGVARFGTILIFAVLTLPTSLNLSSSFSQDGLITACCALAAALLTRCRPGFSPAWCAALALLIAVAAAKTPYVALTGFLLPPLLAAGFWRRTAVVALACLAPALWLLHAVHFGFMPYARPPYHPGPLWPGPRDIVLDDVLPRYNLRVLLAQPWQIVALPLTSFAESWPLTWPRVLGMMSCDTVLISAWEFPLLAAALLCAAAAAARPQPGSWRGGDVWFAALALFGAFTGMEIAMYITFTRAGLGWIEGVQGRYFLPLLPFLIFILPAAGALAAAVPGVRRLPATALAGVWGWLCLPAMAMLIVNSYALPALIFHLFRMPGP